MAFPELPRAANRLPAPLHDLDLTLTTVLWAAAAVVATVLVARYAARATLHFSARVQWLQDDLALQAARVVRYFVLVVGAGVVLAVLGADIQPVLVAMLLLLLGAALMAKGIADNVGAGLVIQARRAIRLGDYVDLAGFRGHVSDLNSRTVVVQTNDGRTVHVPNRAVLDEPFANLSIRGRLRSEVEVRLRTTAGHDRADAGQELATALLAVHGVLESPAPHALLVHAEPDRHTFTVQFWHEPEAGPQVCSRVAGALDGLLTSGHRSGAVAWPPLPAPLTVPGDL